MSQTDGQMLDKKVIPKCLPCNAGATIKVGDTIKLNMLFNDKFLNNQFTFISKIDSTMLNLITRGPISMYWFQAILKEQVFLLVKVSILVSFVQFTSESYFFVLSIYIVCVKLRVYTN